MPAALSGALHKHGRGAGPPASGHTRPSFTQRICDRRLSRTPRARLHSAFAREIWVSNSVEGVAGRTPLSEGAGALGSAERTLDGDVVGKPPDRRRGDLRYAHPGWYAEYASGWPVPPSEQREPERCIGERPGPLPNPLAAKGASNSNVRGPIDDPCTSGVAQSTPPQAAPSWCPRVCRRTLMRWLKP